MKKWKQEMKRGWAQWMSIFTASTFLWTTLVLSIPGMAFAQPRPGDNRVRIYRFDTVHGPDVSDMMALRIDEFYKAILDVNSGIHLLIDEDLIIGIAQEVQEKKTNPALLKADESLWKGKEKVERGRYRDALKLLGSAIGAYEKNFVDLVDYDKLVDAYLHLAIAQFEKGYKDNARETMDTLIVLRPDTRVDPRKYSPEFIEMLEGARQRSQARPTGQLYVSSEPMGADVFIDGIAVGKAPTTLSGVLQGNHYIQVRAQGMQPWGQVVNVSGASLKTINANLSVDGDQEMAEIDGEYVPPDPLIPYKDTGDFGSNFKRAARYFCAKAYVNNLLYSYISRSDEGYKLHMFLYDASIGEIAELEPIQMQKDLSDLQIKLLDTETTLMKGVTAFPMSRVVSDPPPSVYRIDRQKAIAGVTPDSANKRENSGGIAVVPGASGTPYGSSSGSSFGSNPSYGSNSSASSGAAMGSSAAPQGTAQSAFGNAPSSTSESAFGSYSSGASAGSTLNNSSSASGLSAYQSMSAGDDKDWQEEWWVWALVGVGAVGVGVGGYLLIDSMNQSDSSGTAFTGTVQLP